MPKIPRLFRFRLRSMVLAAVLTGLIIFFEVRNPRAPVEETEIYQGVYYTCERLPATEDAGGLVHVVRVDLKADGIELWTTPVDGEARKAGFDYETQHVGSVLKDENLSAVVNGTLFSPAPKWRIWPNWEARSLETVISNHVSNHADKDRDANSYLVWFEDDLRPHVEHSKPPPAEAMKDAKWGVGVQAIQVMDGHVSGYLGPGPTSEETMIAVDEDRKMLWLIAFERASQLFAAQYAVKLGAKDGGLLDGGGSTSMAIGYNSAAPGGTLIGGWRPVAVQFGVRGRVLEGGN